MRVLVCVCLCVCVLVWVYVCGCGCVCAARVNVHPRRQYLEEHLIDFAKANPQIEIAVSVRNNRHPWIRGYFLRDRDKTLSLRNLSVSQIVERVSFLRDTRPINMYKDAKAFALWRSAPFHGRFWRPTCLPRPSWHGAQ